MEFPQDLNLNLFNGEPLSSGEILRQRNSTAFSVFCWTICCVIAAVIWGYLDVEQNHVHSCFQKIFYVSWIAQFYPQVYLNFTRKTTAGLSIDSWYLSGLGYFCFCVYSSCTSFQLEMFGTKSKYNPLVQRFEVFFALHGLVFNGIIMLQMYHYNRGTSDISPRLNFLVVFFVAVNALYLILIASRQPSSKNFVVSSDEWLLSLVYSTGVILTIRWIPQAWKFYSFATYQGLSATTLILQLLGSIAAIIMILYDGYR